MAGHVKIPHHVVSAIVFLTGLMTAPVDANGQGPAGPEEHQPNSSNWPPEIKALYGTNGVVVIVFDEPTTNGLNASNFRITASDGSHQLVIALTAYTSGTNTGQTLLLRTDAATPFRPDTPYNLYLAGIEDLFRNRMVPTMVAIPLFPSTLLQLNATHAWRYETSGTNFSNAWYRVDFDDGGWP